MIISKKKILYDSNSNVDFVDLDRFKVYFKGLIYINGFKCGYDTIVEVVNNLSENGKINFNKIKGNYFIIIIDNQKKYKYIFSDNSGIMKIYFNNDTISNSFLELINSNNLSDKKLNYRSIMDFLHFGFIYFNETFLNDVSILSKDKYFEIDDFDNVLSKDKSIAKISDEIALDFYNHFEYINKALTGKKISIDLTGGIDSRLIVTMLSTLNSDFELAISGINGNKDIKIASKIAKIIKKEFFPTYHNPTNITESDLFSIFDITDAQIDIVGYHRNYQLNQERKQRGVDIQISGVGGELYKDFWWLQDFPFYKRKKSNIEKLYNFRIESIGFPHHILEKEMQQISQNFKQLTIERLNDYLLEFNTQTYDNIYYNYKMQGNASAYIRAASNYFTSFAPLLDLDLVRFGFLFSRNERFFNNFHREQISKYNSELAKIKTTELISCSSSTIYKCADVFSYLYDKQLRLSKQILRKIVKKTHFQETPTDNRIYGFVKEFSMIAEIENILKKNRIINHKTDIKSINNNYFGRFITLGLFLKRIGE
ncbi:MAG: hypothetical protein DRJ01_10855 [Bacteroidetes bacterium]|nr:MAG: hypothetical protein DRJ01_10855 [Bacteroidota bacterium]